MRGHGGAMRCAPSLAVLVVLLVLGGCAPRGTGEPPGWDLPERWSDHTRGGTTAIVLQGGDRAEVSGLRRRDADCAAAGEVVLDGAGSWSWAGYGRIRIELGEHVVHAGAASYRGELDWDRLLVPLCERADRPGSPVLELFVSGTFFRSREGT